MWILDHFSPFLTIAGYRILTDLLAFHFSYSHQPILAMLDDMTDTDKIMNPERFGANWQTSRSDLNPD